MVALAAAALSYASLTELGVLAGYAQLSFLFPIVVDAGAAASCAAWLHTRGRQPLVMTWALLAISIVLNGTEHFLTSTGTPPSWLLVVAVAAVPPTVLGLCVHLAVGLGAATEGPEVDTGAQNCAPVGDDPAELREASTRSDPDPIAELIESGAGRRRIAQVAGVSEHVARRMIEERR